MPFHLFANIIFLESWINLTFLSNLSFQGKKETYNKNIKTFWDYDTDKLQEEIIK